jgi:hypothetical protein
VEVSYYKCLVPDCKLREVFDHLPSLALRYRNEHHGAPSPGRETVTVKEISPGYQLHMPVKNPPGTPSAAFPDNPSGDRSMDESAAPSSVPLKTSSVYKETP